MDGWIHEWITKALTGDLIHGWTHREIGGGQTGKFMGERLRKEKEERNAPSPHSRTLSSHTHLLAFWMVGNCV